MILTKSRPLSEVQQIKKAFPNFDKTPLSMSSDTNGNILKLDTNDQKIITWLKKQGFKEKS